MASPADSDRSQQEEMLREQISRSLVEQLRNSNFDWTALQSLQNPVLRIEACLEERPTHLARQSTPGMVVSHFVDLSGIASIQPPSPVTTTAAATPNNAPSSHPASPSFEKPGVILPSAAHHEAHRRLDAPTEAEHAAAAAATTVSEEPSTAGNSRNASPEPSPESNQRKDLSGLRPAKVNAASVEAEADSQRQIHSGDKFPKRRKLKPVGHFLKPSTLDKLIGGIWEQIHGDIDLSPRHLQGPWQIEGHDGQPSNQLTVMPSQPVPPHGDISRSAAPAAAHTTANRPADGTFSQNNAFCRQVTQASRACRALEVIVQARWVEHFEEYVDACAAARPAALRTKHNKAAILRACADFGWSEKELRNKAYVWRGYKEIKDAGGWTTLIFSGMGIYRFCKYRIGFDHDSLGRLRSLRPALEVAADTLHPHWRQLLAVVGESPERVYQGHPHDWVVALDGSSPVPLRNTYLQWDPDFAYRQIDESVIDHAAWGCDDPRWQPPAGAAAAMMRQGGESEALPICETCGKEQSDDPNRNACYCFPTLFGCAKTNPSPVLVFRTPDGRNNGLLALCAFERGAPVGEFVGLVTRGYQDVDVFESSLTTPSSATSHSAGGGGSTSSGRSTEKYQIWQGRQGNFTRFVNHSCKANAQYHRFAWMNTQRVILVSKGIEAGAEVTVDYGDKYWKGLDKRCLCGESCCRYRRANR
ncbi:DEAD-domain-containing protein [Apiospora aurea]|uniref:DEAD-domain-containing protein n=1 Tax=Apiospora aurea TaxID=335848 RepID=A0ABR1QUD0_9PEZI